MSEMPPPPPTPPPPDGFGPDDASATPPILSPPSERWSKTAISGFVLSLIGCLGITAALGFVFGIFGLMATRGGRLRGRGLAIAALPVSILTGALFLCLLLVLAMGQEFRAMNKGLAALLRSESARTEAVVAQFRLVCSEGFNKAVGDDHLLAWFDEMQAKHGTLVEEKLGKPTTSGEAMAFLVEAKFTEGVAVIEMLCTLEGLHLRLDDVNIDGSSPRPAG